MAFYSIMCLYKHHYLPLKVVDTSSVEIDEIVDVKLRVTSSCTFNIICTCDLILIEVRRIYTTKRFFSYRYHYRFCQKIYVIVDSLI